MLLLLVSDAIMRTVRVHFEAAFAKANQMYRVGLQIWTKVTPGGPNEDCKDNKSLLMKSVRYLKRLINIVWKEKA